MVARTRYPYSCGEDDNAYNAEFAELVTSY